MKIYSLNIIKNKMKKSRLGIYIWVSKNENDSFIPSWIIIQNMKIHSLKIILLADLWGIADH